MKKQKTKQRVAKTIIGLDLSMSSTGYAVVEVSDNKEVRLIKKGLIKGNSNQSHHKRLTKQHEVLRGLSTEYTDTTIVKEQLLFSPPKPASILAKVHGVTDLVFPKVHQIYPSTVKKLVTGNGRANKQEVADAVYEHLDVTKDELTFETDDESDAIAVVFAYLLK